jgi:hypothetical protein
MDKMPIAVILQGIPETILLFMFGVAIIGEYINFKKILIISIIYPFVIMFIRSLIPNSLFGLHIVFALIIINLIFWKVLNFNFKKSFISAITSLSFLILLEILVNPILYNIFNTSLARLLQNENLQRLFFSLPVTILYALITFILYKFKWSLIRGKRTIENDC